MDEALLFYCHKIAHKIAQTHVAMDQILEIVKKSFQLIIPAGILLNCYIIIVPPCTYVCMYRGRPSWRCPWDRAFQLGQGEGPIGLVGPISQPRGTIDTASLTLVHTCLLYTSDAADE